MPHDITNRSDFLAWPLSVLLVSVVAIAWYSGRQASSDIMENSDFGQVGSGEHASTNFNSEEPINLHSEEETHKQEIRIPTPDPQVARVRVGLKEEEVSHNALGEFPRLPVPINTDITADVIFTETKLGDVIHALADDGGIIIVDASGALSADDDGRVRIRFKPSAYEGLQRVTLRHGAQRRVLQFWVGPEPPVSVPDSAPL